MSENLDFLRENHLVLLAEVMNSAKNHFAGNTFWLMLLDGNKAHKVADWYKYSALNVISFPASHLLMMCAVYDMSGLCMGNTGGWNFQQ